MNMLRDAWEQLQDVRWDEMDWSLVWKSAAIGAACSLACIVCCVAVVFMSPRLQAWVEQVSLGVERERRSRVRAQKRVRSGQEGAGDPGRRGGWSCGMRVLVALLVLVAAAHIAAPWLGAGGGGDSGAQAAGVAGWAAQGRVFAQVTWRSAVGAASRRFSDWDVEGFESAAARVRAGVASARSAAGAAAPRAGAADELGLGIRWEERGGLRMPVFSRPAAANATAGAAPASAADAGAAGRGSAAAHPMNGAPRAGFAALVAKEARDGGARPDGAPCVNLAIGLGTCSKGGRRFWCEEVPGAHVELETEPAPSARCLNGSESWGACSGGEFLCEPRAPQAPTLLHTVFSVQPSRYFEWQSRFLAYHFNKSAQAGPLTRLLSGARADHLVTELRTWVAPPYRHLQYDPYVPYNKPAAIAHWLRYSGARPEYVVVVDPDCIFLRPLVSPAPGGNGVLVHLGSGRDVLVTKGNPFAQKGYMDWVPGGPFESLTKHFCPGCGRADALAVPLVIHREDLEAIAPLWLSTTERIRAEKASWAPEWSKPSFALSWTAEMYGYIFAAAQLGIKHSVSDRAQEIVGFNKRVKAPVLHYSLKLQMGKGPDGREVQWHKYFENAGTVIPEAPAGQTEVVATLLAALRDARDHLPPSTKSDPPAPPRRPAAPPRAPGAA